MRNNGERERDRDRERERERESNCPSAYKSFNTKRWRDKLLPATLQPDQPASRLNVATLVAGTRNAGRLRLLLTYFIPEMFLKT